MPAAGAKALSLGQKAANSSVFNPMRYVNAVRSSWAGRKAAIWAARSDELGQIAAHYGDLGGYARSLSGQTVNGVVSNVSSNNLAYGLGDFQEHTVGGYARATVSGVGVGVLSPRVTPLRQNYLSGSTVEEIAGYGIDRVGDYALGVFNYVVTPQENSLSITDANKEGLKSMLSGVSGGISSSSADAIRPVTPLP